MQVSLKINLLLYLLMQILKNIWFSFPMQLLILHCRRHLFLISSFIILALLVTKGMAARYGVAYLFLDPEYMGHVSFLGFYLVGLAFGLFTVLWNITSYILNSHKFPFLATFKYPFFRFCLNNFIVPILFALIYIFALIDFQSKSELRSFIEISWLVVAWVLGATTGFLFTITKSLNTRNKDVEDFEEDDIKKKHKKIALHPWRFNPEDDENQYKALRVDYALMYPWKVRRVRRVDHYRRSILMAVFRQHQKNALVLELIALELIVLLGFLMDSAIFRLPAAVSIFLLFSILISPIGAFNYWLRTWAVTAFIGLLLVFNLLIKFDVFTHHNKAFGFNYSEPKKEYDLKAIEATSTPQKVYRDSLAMISILNNWKYKMQEQQGNLSKPKMVLINASGGGMRSAVWGFYLMQMIDSVSKKSFLDNVELICGASGGTLGQAYFRELYRMRKNSPDLNLQSPEYLDNISKDLLNAVCFALVVNDVFVPWQKFNVGDNIYNKDRGYLWERQLNDNTNGVLKKEMGYYKKDEKEGNIPILVFTPTIIDDGRRLNISNFPVSFLNKPIQHNEGINLRTDGIDAVNFFGEDNANNLLFTTAIRMNATFPYIMPNVFLPTSPAIQTMDAGLRDNYGIETSLRYLYTFKKWIDENTSGVVILQTRDYEKNSPPHIDEHPSLIQRKLEPINSIYSNWMDFQDFHNDASFSTVESWLNVDVNLISFEYIPTSLNTSASMSWHLTEKEKKDIFNSINTPHNLNELKKLKELMNY